MLEGKVVLDLSWVLGGPFGGQTLAQMGAEVIKIEPIDGDMARYIPPVRENTDSAFYLSVNRGKKSVALNLRDPEGLQVFYDLVASADAVIYGFSPAVPERLGIDYAKLSEINPRIVIGQIVGLDDKGAYADAPAFDLVVQAMTGVMSITGQPGGPPARVGYQIADLAGGLYVALATVGALLGVASTGKGERVQISLFDAQIALLTWQAQNFLLGGEVPAAIGARHAMIAPSDAFKTKDLRYIAVSPTGERFWDIFCRALETPRLIDDQRFSSASRRLENVGALTEEVARIIARRTAAEWDAVFVAARVPAAVVNTVDEALAHPITTARRMIEQVRSPRDGAMHSFLGNPFKRDDLPILGYPPRIGEHTDEILRRFCGYDEAQLAGLESRLVIFRGDGRDQSETNAYEKHAN